MKISDQTVLITGASGGIGRALALKLAEEKANLILTGRNAETLAALQQQILNTGTQCRYVVADITTEVGRHAILASCLESPRVTTLINCMGTNSFESFERQSEQQIIELIQTNLTSTMLLTHTILPELLKLPEALLITIGSTFGGIGYPGYAAYCASKFGLRGFHEALQRELADSTVKSLYVAPRATDTGINSDKVVALNNELGNHMDSPTWVAEQVLRAMRKNLRSTYLGWPEKLFVRLNGIFPALVGGAIIKQLPIIKKYLLQ